MGIWVSGFFGSGKSHFAKVLGNLLQNDELRTGRVSAASLSSANICPRRSPEGRDDLMTVRRRLADILPMIDPTEYQDQREARRSLDDMFRHEKITAEGVADELAEWVDAQPTTGGKVQHLVFVIDEMGSFSGDSIDRIGELNSLAEMIGNKGKGKVWLIVTS